MNREQKLIVFVAVLASLLEIIDTSIVNVAIPTMMGNLGATLEDISMVITGYAIANAIVLPLSAWLGDRIGRRKYYLGCIIAFTATSVACGFAPNLLTLTIFRILQGLAGGALLPTSQALIYEQFPREKAGMAGAIFGMSVMIGPTLGPTLGGYLTDTFGWRSIFNVNLPLGLLALVIGAMVIFDRPQDEHEKAAHASAPIDVWGLVLLTLGIGCLQYTLERGEADDWFSSNVITLTTFLAAACLPLFIWWELKVKHPIINLRLFKDPIVRSGVALMTMVGFFLFAVVFVLPVFVGRVFHYDATQTGLLFIPGSLLTAAMMPFVGKQLAKRDPRVLIGIGLIAIEVCLIMMAQFSVDTSHGALLTALYVRGFAMAFMFVPINSSVLSQFKGVNLGQVSGLMNLSRQIGGGVGIALVATLLNVKTQQNYLDLTSKVSMLNQQTQVAVRQAEGGLAAKMVESVGAASAHDATLKSLYYRILNQAFMMSFIQLMYTIAIIVLLAFIPLMMLKVRNKPTGPVMDH
jgi:DHA2 family multidrug resistance protein